MDTAAGKHTSPGAIRIAAAGDLLLAAQPSGAPGRNPADIFSPMRDIFAQCDIVMANLECTLPGDGGTVDTEPRVISTPDMVAAIGPAGFDALTLANNHAFDCLHEGFCATRDAVAKMGIASFGAGDNLEQAAAPAIIERNGISVAFLAAVDRRSGPSQFAQTSRWGVAPLDVAAITARISELTGQVDHVIVSPHWGEERFLIPSPEQIDQAHAFVDAGASMVLGHHPHVVQGMEVYKGAPIIYSLGNFVADSVHWTDGDVMHWNRTERTGCVLTADLTADAVTNVQQIPTYDDGQRVAVDSSGFGDRRITRANTALARGVTLKRYRREHLIIKTIKPALAHLRFSELVKLRPRHFANAFSSLVRSRKAK